MEQLLLSLMLLLCCSLHVPPPSFVVGLGTGFVLQQVVGCLPSHIHPAKPWLSIAIPFITSPSKTRKNYCLGGNNIFCNREPGWRPQFHPRGRQGSKRDLPRATSTFLPPGPEPGQAAPCPYSRDVSGAQFPMASFWKFLGSQGGCCKPRASFAFISFPNSHYPKEKERESECIQVEMVGVHLEEFSQKEKDR